MPRHLSLSPVLFNCSMGLLCSTPTDKHPSAQQSSENSCIDLVPSLEESRSAEGVTTVETEAVQPSIAVESNSARPMSADLTDPDSPEAAITQALSFDEITARNITNLATCPLVEYQRPATFSMHIELVPHVHTLFCERKQRVCGSVGKIQELEILRLESVEDGVVPTDIVWLRSAGEDSQAFFAIPGSEGLLEYHLNLQDVGCFISARYSVPSGDSAVQEVCAGVGPVLPGPPRLMKFTVGGKLWSGGYAVAQTDYVGGYEGASEYWWLRIRDGVREQVRPLVVSDPLTALNTDPLVLDPRVYHLGTDDVGCVLKVKCRPVRSDAFKGEIFTSMPSVQVAVHSPESIIDGSSI